MSTSSCTSWVLMAIPTAEPSPAAVMTCARGLVALPAAHDAGNAGAPLGVGAHQAAGQQLAAEHRGGRAGVRAHRRADEDRIALEDATVGEPQRAQPVVGHDELVDDSLDDLDPAGVQRGALGQEDGVVVRDEDDVVAPLAQQVRVRDGLRARAQHADGPVADLPTPWQ